MAKGGIRRSVAVKAKAKAIKAPSIRDGKADPEGKPSTGLCF